MLSTQQIITHVPVKVVEICFDDDPAAAPEIAVRIIREHSASIRAVRTSSDLEDGTSVLHVHVLAHKLDEFFGQHSYVKDSGGAMMITAPPSTT